MRFRPTVAVVDLEAVRHNTRVLKPPNAELMAVVKAGGYGHDDLAVAGASLEAEATWLGVALVEEGVRLRRAGFDAPVLVLSEVPPGSEEETLRSGLTPALYTDEGLEGLAKASAAHDLPARVHLKVDTGMHRVGIAPSEAVAFARRVVDRGVEIEGVWTHLATSEEVHNPAAREQLSRFLATCESLEAAGIRPRYRHAANSGATMCLPESHLDMVRVGDALYGLCPGPDLEGIIDLRPAMSLRSEVRMVKRVDAGEGISYGLTYQLRRPSTIATVPIGYADGYVRALSNRGRVLIRGRRYPVAGTVTMDQIMIDLGDDPVSLGDEVVLFGRQGDSEIRVEEVAAWAGTLGYEIVCGVSPRVPRDYVG